MELIGGLRSTDLPDPLTDMNTSPGSQIRVLTDLWYALLREAVQEGFVALEDLYAEIRKGHVSPELPDWAGLPAPKDAPELLNNWVPPYKRFATGSGVTKHLKPYLRGLTQRTDAASF